ncbi:MAG: DUF2339 domain-containing protein [Candidatus Omnitrophota bacterium]
MRQCPKCKRKFDDTWKICINCNCQLEDIASEDAAKEGAPKGPKAPEQPKPAKPVKEKKKFGEGFEIALAIKWFNKLGLLAVVVGIALLISYSFQFLTPALKILIGYASGGIMIALGTYLEKKKNLSAFGMTIAGGGWAIIYFTTFAMCFMPIVQLIKNPLLGMVLLLGVSVGTVAHIYKYRSQIATAFSYLLIFITLMVAPPTIYSLIAIVFAAASFLFFVYKMKWTAFPLYGVVMTYITYVATFREPELTQQFLISFGFLVLYWAIFSIAIFLLKEEKKKDVSASTDFSNLTFNIKHMTLIINTAFASLCGAALIEKGFQSYIIPALILGAALHLFLTFLFYTKGQRTSYLISSVISILFTGYLIVTECTGYSLTVSLVLMAQIILLLGVMLKEIYWRIISFTLLALILGKLLFIDIYMSYIPNMEAPFLINSMSRGYNTLIFGIAFLVYIVNQVLYSNLKSKGAILPAADKYPFCVYYTYPIIFALGTWFDLPKVLTAPCWVALGVILLQIGITKNEYRNRIMGYVLTVAAFIRLLMSNILIQGGISGFSYRLITSLPVIIILYYCLMSLQDKDTEKMLGDKEKKMIFLYPYMVFAGIMLLTSYELPTAWVAPAWGLLAVAYSLRGVYTKRNHYLSISSISAISAMARGVYINLLPGKYLAGAETSAIYPIIAVSALYAGNLFYLRSRESLKLAEETGRGRIRLFLHSSRFVYGLAATILLTTMLIVKLEGALVTVGLGLEGLILFLGGFWMKEKSWRVFGLLVLLTAIFKAFIMDLRQLGAVYYILALIVLGIVLLFVSYMYTKYKEKIKKLT